MSTKLSAASASALALASEWLSASISYSIYSPSSPFFAMSAALGIAQANLALLSFARHLMTT